MVLSKRLTKHTMNRGDWISPLSRKITGILFTQYSLASAATITTGTLNSIVGKELSHQAGWAGVPTAVFLLGGALAAFGWGYVFDSIGRRRGLAAGLILGSIGSAIAFYAAIHSSFIFFLAGLAFIGVATAAVNLGRFAAAEVSPPENRARAISSVVMGGSIGSILGTLLTGPAMNLTKLSGVGEMAALYLAGLALFAIASLVVFIGLRPDPQEVGRKVAAKFPDAVEISGAARSVSIIIRQPAPLVAVLSMVLAQMAMWLLLAIIPLYMHDHNHDLLNISLVIALHSLGMYAFSIFPGKLADRFGRGPVILFGSVTLILSCLAVTFSPDIWSMGIGLFLLGLGWNFCYVAGSALLSEQLFPKERVRMQGINDLLVGLASMVASLGSGVTYASLGYNAVGLISAAFSVILFAAGLIWFQIRRCGMQKRPEVTISMNTSPIHMPRECLWVCCSLST